MKVTLADIQTRPTAINKDLSGGFGTSSDYGSGWAAWLLKRLKKDAVRIPVLMLGYLASVLRRHGHEVRFTTKEPVAGTDVYLIYASLVEHNAELAFARRVRRGGARAGFVGSLASAMPERLVGDADFVISGGDAETPFLEEGGKKLDFQGIIQGRWLSNLDELPFPDWQAFPYREFRYAHYLKKSPTFTLSASRGCPYTCGYYCPYPAFQGKQFRMRSVENVVEEMAYLAREYGARSLLFRDPVFSLEKKRIRELCEAIRGKNLKIEWACETHLARLDPELIDMMQAAGCRGINVGVESVNPEILKSMHRTADNFRHQEEMIRYCEHKGVRIGAFFIFGNPEDTEETILSTIAYAQSLESSYAQFTINTPYPGTGYYEEMKPKLIETNLERFDIYTPTFKHEHLSKEALMRLKEKAYRDYYIRPSWLLRHLSRSVA